MTPITTGPTRRRTTAVGAIALLTVTILAAGCANDTLERAAASPATTAPRVTAPATFTATPSIGQVTVTRAEPGDELQLVDADERVVARGTADDTGSLIFYDVPPAEGYRVIHDGSASSGPSSPRSMASRRARCNCWYSGSGPLGSRPCRRWISKLIGGPGILADR